jgi:hypothetical protein
MNTVTEETISASKARLSEGYYLIYIRSNTNDLKKGFIL